MRHSSPKAGTLLLVSLTALAAGLAEAGPAPLSLDELGGIGFRLEAPPEPPLSATVEPAAVPVVTHGTAPLAAGDLAAIVLQPSPESAGPAPAEAAPPPAPAPVTLAPDALARLGISRGN